jgi:hypothetical protein
LCGIDLARHDTTARLVLGKTKLPETAARARTQITNVIGDLHNRARDNVESSVSLNECIMRSKSFKLANNNIRTVVKNDTGHGGTLFGAVLKEIPVSLDISSATFTSKPFLVLSPWKSGKA